MKRFITVVSLSLGLVTVSGVSLAQETGVPVINADGDAVRSNAGLNPAADADGPTLIYGDLNPGPGTNVIGPPVEVVPVSSDLAPAPVVTGDKEAVLIPGTTGNITAADGDAAALGPGNASAAPGTVTSDGDSGMSLLGPDGTYSVTEVTPSDVSVGEAGAAPVYEPVYEPVSEPVYEPVYEPAPVETVDAVKSVETAEPVVADTAPATETDLDADNYPDALEWDLGIDPNNIDTDADGAADGDELNIYGTEPTLFDTDGDGLSDGQELFDSRTDPLVWDTDGDGLGDGETVAA